MPIDIDKFKSRNGVSVSDVLILFNCSSLKFQETKSEHWYRKKKQKKKNKNKTKTQQKTKNKKKKKKKKKNKKIKK